MTDDHKRLAVLRQKLSRESEPLERDAIKAEMRDLSAELARRDYEAKAGPLLREMAGSY